MSSIILPDSHRQFNLFIASIGMHSHFIVSSLSPPCQLNSLPSFISHCIPFLLFFNPPLALCHPPLPLPDLPSLLIPPSPSTDSPTAFTHPFFFFSAEESSLTRTFMFISLFQGEVQLTITLTEEKEDHILGATAWALGQIGRHSAEHAKAVALANVLPQLLKLYLSSDPSSDLCSKVAT